MSAISQMPEVNAQMQTSNKTNNTAVINKISLTSVTMAVVAAVLP